MKAERLSDTELRALAQQIDEGNVFITNSAEGIEHSFGFLVGAMMMKEDTPEEDVETWGAFYEEISKAGPRGINGYPFFFSMKILHKDDIDPLDGLIQKAKQHREAFLTGVSS